LGKYLRSLRCESLPIMTICPLGDMAGRRVRIKAKWAR
jgi:hypothetical protein